MAKGFVNLAELQALWAAHHKVKKPKNQPTVELWFDRQRDSLSRKDRKMPASNGQLSVSLKRSARVVLSVGSALHFA